jgi:hypothetical protein
LLGDSERIIEYFDYVKATAHTYFTKWMVPSQHFHRFDFESGTHLSDYTGQQMDEIA